MSERAQTGETTIVRAAIYPAIGIARLGNSESEYFLAPEVTDPLPEPPGFYRDSTGALKRQAVRFRVYRLREHRCPSTGNSGACPGYWRDHVVPLACGGPDAVSNTQWQTVADARAKDRWERRGCAR
jgi:L-Lysine epsilon oxidase N-terminal